MSDPNVIILRLLIAAFLTAAISMLARVFFGPPTWETMWAFWTFSFLMCYRVT